MTSSSERVTALSIPSIPSRYQTILVSGQEFKEAAFTSTSARFNGPINELPGPGYYCPPKSNTVEENCPSSIFCSKTKRLDNALPNAGSQFPSPVQYEPKTPVYSRSLAYATSAAFKEDSLLPSAVRLTQSKKKSVPGPGHYTIPESTNAIVVIKKTNGPTSTFRSKSVRLSSEMVGSLDTPPPSYYKIQTEILAKGVPAATAAFKATSREYHQQQRMQALQYSKNSSSYPFTVLNKYQIEPKSTAEPDLFRGKPISSHPRIIRGTAVAFKPKTPPAKPALPGPGAFDIVNADRCVWRVPARTIIAPLARTLRAAPGWNANNLGPGVYDPIPPSFKATSFHFNPQKAWSF